MTKKKKTLADEERRLSFMEHLFGNGLVIEDDDTIQRINVMTRVRADVVGVLDALVELGAFNSRSESVAVYLEQAILSQIDLYEKLKERAKEVGKMRESALDHALDAIQDNQK